MEKLEISAEFPFDSHCHYVDVKDSKIHYIDVGNGDPIVFLHSVPSWCYVWRNILPGLQDIARCIAPDFIGFGRSGKPDISYRVFDHSAYFNAFMEKLALSNVTLVLHGWGSLIGLEYFRQFPEKVKAMVFMESHIRPPSGWETLSLPMQELASLMNVPDGGFDAIINQNYFIDTVLPGGVLRPLSDKEMEYYREPFPTPESRKPIWQYLHDLPLGDTPQDVMALMNHYSAALQRSTIPKLLIYAIPGYVTTISMIEWAKNNLSNLTVADVGEGLHYLQETVPEAIVCELRNWYLSNHL